MPITQQPFEQLKAIFSERCKEKHACTAEFRRVLNATTEQELLTVILENLSWCHNNKVIDDDFFAGFTPEVFLTSGIANGGKGNTGWANTGDRNTGDSNTGDRNTGYRNTGDSNTGDSNTGYSNTGYRNTGDSNTGDRNTGDWNTGDSNTGDRNTGDSNTGDRNTGDSNTGDRNTGDWNTGDRNTGYCNTGDWNTGVFCTGEPDTIKMFNKPSNWTVQDFKNSFAHQLLIEYVYTKQWIEEANMTDEEKAAHIGYKTAGGYYKDVPYKEAFTKAWANWNKYQQHAFLTLPNFDATIFEQITGVNVAVPET